MTTEDKGGVLDKVMPKTAEKVVDVTDPKAVLRELNDITDAVVANTAPMKPRLEKSAKELLLSEQKAPVFSVAAYSVAALGVATAIMLFSVVLSGMSIAAMAMVGIGIYSSTNKMEKFEAKILRKSYYSKQHLAVEERNEAVMAEYQKRLKKHAKVLKRMQKRAKPLIESYELHNPDMTLALVAGEGFIPVEKYSADQKKMTAIGSGVVGTKPSQFREIVSAREQNNAWKELDK